MKSRYLTKESLALMLAESKRDIENGYYVDARQAQEEARACGDQHTERFWTEVIRKMASGMPYQEAYRRVNCDIGNRVNGW